jgi:hypothetical protein
VEFDYEVADAFLGAGVTKSQVWGVGRGLWTLDTQVRSVASYMCCCRASCVVVS